MRERILVRADRQRYGAEQHRSRAVRHPWMRVRYLAMIVICGWAAVYFLHAERPQLKQLQAQNVELQNQLHRIQTQQQTLQKEKQQLNDPSYIEKYATEHQNLVMPNQVPFDLQPNGHKG